jgi:hypothetical protein
MNFNERETFSPRSVETIVPLLKLKKNSAEFILKMIKFWILRKKITKMWKTEKIILIYKSDYELTPPNEK